MKPMTRNQARRQRMAGYRAVKAVKPQEEKPTEKTTEKQETKTDK